MNFRRIVLALASSILTIAFSFACVNPSGDTYSGIPILPLPSAGELPQPEGSAADYTMIVNDVRGSKPFAFETLDTVALSVKLKAADSRSRSSSTSTNLVQIRDPENGRVLYRGVPGADGSLSGNFTIETTVSQVELEFTANARSYSVPVDTRDLLKIDRTIEMRSTATAGAGAEAPVDSDGDGIPDSVDDFPNDPRRATIVNYPAQGRYTIAFEDLYPVKGDADFNDYVVQARITEELNAAGAVVRIRGSYRHVARAAGYKHSLKLNLPVGPAEYTLRHYEGGNGASAGDLLETIIDRVDAFADVALTARSDLTITSQNAQPGQSYVPGDLFEIDVTPDTPVAKTVLGAPPYDLYLFVHNTGREVHFPGRSYESNGDDTYLDSDGFPWALLVPVEWRWMYETRNIHQAYVYFDDWYQSGGRIRNDWYNFPDLQYVFENVTTHLTAAPQFTPPAGYDRSDFVVQGSLIPLPSRLGTGGHYVPIGSIYDISPAGGGSITFAGEPARIEYSYNEAALRDAGYLEEFAAYYYDALSDTWKPVDRLVADPDNDRVIVYTSHLTPFVLGALPAGSNGNTPAGPGCLATDYPSGIGGTAGAEFSTINTTFRYYADRDYTILPTGASSTNATTFAALGFAQAVGIATCNGDSSCGSAADHKLYTGDGYLDFTAHTDLDVYVMYDSRGGSGVGDTSDDAPWLGAAGFADTGYLVETTDAVRFYTVYRKTYSAGATVRLDGNRKGAGPGIQTNYWVILKPAGVTAAQPAATLCVSAPDTTPPQLPNTTAVAGATEVLLLWTPPPADDYAGMVIRRSTTTYPLDINQGDAVTGTQLSPQSFRDEGLTVDTNYFYTLFVLDTNNNYFKPGAFVSVRTRADSDGDGLNDNYENTLSYAFIFPGSPAPNQTCAAAPCPNGADPADTDGDGIGDGLEVAAGTDPTNPDTNAPVITNFARTSPAQVSGNPTVTFTLSANDDAAVTGYQLTLTDDAPLATQSVWDTATPSSFTVPSVPGVYQIYAWVRDTAGNVNSAYPPITFELLPGPAPDADYVDYCYMFERQLNVVPGSAVPGVSMEAYEPDITTDGLGGDPNALTAEAGFGTGTDPTTYTYVPIAYAPGGLVTFVNNFPYAGNLYSVEPAEGTYRFVTRVRRTDEPFAWTYCDNNFERGPVIPADVGTLELRNLPTASGIFAVSQEENNGVEVYWSPATGADGYIVYYGTSPGLTTSSPSVAVASGTSTIITNLTPGTTYYVAVAASFGGTPGPLSAETTAVAGQNLVHYCRTYQTSITASASGAPPIITMEVFEFDITIGFFGSNSGDMIVEAGYGNGNNLAGYTWRSIGFAKVTLDNPNNYDYEGNVYATAPAPGTYNVLTRARRTDQPGAWRYCDANVALPFNYGSITVMTVNP